MMRLAFAALLCAVASGCGGEVDDVAVGRPAPAYGAPALDGDTVTLASLRGAPVLLNVWATWCHPCQEEMPDLQALQDEFESRGLRVVGVSIDQQRAGDEIRHFLEEHAIDFLILHDATSTVSHRFRTAGVPETFLIDADGVLRGRWIGQASADDMRPAILRVIGLRR
jgi:cytochrome c biogenesis protein CcmG/thiol:disulfide interchange protein DsbE